jgi:signal transduction histidine kinase
VYGLLDYIEDELFVIDNSYNVKFLNRALKNKIGSKEGKCFEIVERRSVPCGPPIWECPVRRVIKEKKGVSFIHPYHEGDGLRYLKVSIYPLEEDSFVEIRRDVSAERELERHIIIHHNHLDAISRISSAVSGLGDLRKILETAIDTILEIFTGSIGGILLLDEKKGVLRYEVYRGLSVNFIEGMEVKKGEGISGSVAERGEPILLSEISDKSGVYRVDLLKKESISSMVSVPLKAKEKVVGVLNVMSNTPNRFKREDMYLLSSVGYQLGMAIEQARLYERLKNARERYKKLLEVAMVIQEEERKRIARELHDETSQNLTALSLNLRAIKDMMEEEGLSKDVKELIVKSHGIAVDASVELTRIIRELRPTLLDTLGLPAAINHLVEANLKSKNIDAEIIFNEMEERLSPETELALFRITQEALSNIIRHSKAKTARIYLNCDEEECVLRIEDDGIGFNVQDIKTIEEGGRGAGLFGMKERVRLIGGYCNIDSKPGAGTKITVHVPKRKTKGDEEDKDPDS